MIGEEEGGPARRVAGEHPDSSFACRQVVDGAAQHGAVDGGERGRHVGRFHLGRPADGVGCELTPDAVSCGSQAVGEIVLHVGLQAHEALEAELRREPHDGRSARACPCRHLGDGAERDALGLREHDIRDPPLAGSQGRAVVLDSLGSGHGTDVTMT